MRVVKDWNHLPASVVHADNLCDFKKKLDDHWKNNQFRLFYPETEDPLTRGAGVEAIAYMPVQLNSKDT